MIFFYDYLKYKIFFLEIFVYEIIDKNEIM